MKLTKNELEELKYHYVDRVVDNMSTKDLVQYVFDDMLRYVETIPEVEFLEDCQDYWEDHYDDVVKDIKEYANSKFCLLYTSPSPRDQRGSGVAGGGW